MANQKTVTGRIADVFGHRFIVETTAGARILADLGPKGLEAFPISEGLAIELEGEQKPSELKVSSIAVAGERPIAIEHGKKGHDEHVKPVVAVRAAEAAGFQPVGEARRKPKHFEILGRKDGAYFECHVTFDGAIRKEKPVQANDEKWSSDIEAAA